MGTTNNYGLRYSESSDPPNGAQQIQDLAEDVDAALAGVANALGHPPAAQMVCSNNVQQFPTGVSAPVTFNSAPIDTAGGWNGSDSYTVREAGVYMLSGSFGWGAVDGGYRNLRIEVNGTAVNGGQASILPIKDSDGLHVTLVQTPTTLQRCSVGDVIKLIAWSTSTTTTAATGSVSTHPEYRPTFNVTKVSD